ncbi:MAG TPA: outer membrane protein transport protein [Aggregicoccus sp.]|nr:outer membrane protein transport protein [Aggregicoccus sp.]
MTIKKTLTVAALLAAGSANAAGFYIGSTQSGRATGMGSAIVGHIDDASANWYNPAGLLGVKKLDIQLGDTGINPRITFTPTQGAPAGVGQEYGQEFSVSPPPHFYAAYRISEQFAAGLGVNVPYAARSNWEDDFVGKDLGHISRLATWHINPNVAFQPHERVRLGVGFNLVRGTIEVERDLNFLTSVGAVRLGGASWGYGLNAGAQVDLVPKLLSLGVTYRGQVNLHFKGDADFQNVPAAFESRLQDQPIGGRVRLPTLVTVGLAATPMEKLTVAADVNWQRWSDFPELFFDFGDDGLVPGTLDAPLKKDWENTLAFRVGAEYGFTQALTGRLGVVYDPTPSPEETLSPDLPDADRIAVALGGGYKLGGLKFDLGYQFVKLMDTDSSYPNLPGTMGGSAHVLSGTIGYSL